MSPIKSVDIFYQNICIDFGFERIFDIASGGHIFEELPILFVGLRAQVFIRAWEPRLKAATFVLD